MSGYMAGSTNLRPASLRIWILLARRRGPRNNTTANPTSSVAHGFSGLFILCTHKAEKAFMSFIEKNEIMGCKVRIEDYLQLQCERERGGRVAEMAIFRAYFGDWTVLG